VSLAGSDVCENFLVQELDAFAIEIANELREKKLKEFGKECRQQRFEEPVVIHYGAL
jgi:hypothetical protein